MTNRVLHSRFAPIPLGRRVAPAILGIALTVAGCAPKSYLVLLEEADGTTGKVIVTQAGISTTVSEAGQGVALDRASPQPLNVSADRLERDFGDAIRAQPMLPLQFLLHFEAGGTQLTAESEARIAELAQAMLERPVPDVSIIGHTDRAGDDQANEALGLERAKAVKDLLGDALKPAVAITVVSHGERDPLVPTADGVAEARNRRVEVTIR